MQDRRDPSNQRAKPGGRRATDPALTTRQCADRIGVTTEFIIGEIRDGRLRALVIQRPGVRTIYRVSPADFDAYIVRYRWNPPTQQNRQAR